MRNNSDYILSLINRTIVILQLSLCLGGVFSLQAQGIKKEVYVESTFRPEISDANKIGTMTHFRFPPALIIQYYPVP
jgi:hypothetical protein